MGRAGRRGEHASFPSLKVAHRQPLDRLPAAIRSSPEAKFLAAEADRKVYGLVQLTHRPRNHEGHSKYYAFSRLSMEEQWGAGYHDAVLALRHPQVLERPDSNDGVSVFDLHVDGRE